MGSSVREGVKCLLNWKEYVSLNHSFSKYLYAPIVPGTGLCGEDILIYKKHLIIVFMELTSSNLFLMKPYNNSAIFQINLIYIISFSYQIAMNSEIFYSHNVSNQTKLITISKMASNSSQVHCSLWNSMSTIFNGFLPKAT